MEASRGSTGGTTGAPWSEQGQSPASAQAAATDDDAFAERPEVYVGAAFAGGLVLAGVLRWLGKR
jgi:hypothetical protein